MKVVQVGPDSSRVGGIRTVMLTLLNSSLADEFGMEIIPTSSITNRIKTFICGFRRLRRLISDGDCDCVHIHMSENASVYRTAVMIHWIKKRSGARVIVESHGGSVQDFFDRCPTFVKQYLLRRLGEADVIVVLTLGWKRWWENLLPNMTYSVVPNSVVVPALGDIEPMKSRSGDRVLFLGELCEQKGVYVLLSAIPEVLAKYPKVQFVFAGKGEVEQCIACAEALGITDNCEFVGWVDCNGKDELFGKTTMLILPSRKESFGIVLLEAMSRCVPVVCSDGGFMHEIVDDEKDGLVFPSGDEAQLAKSIIRLLDDREMAERMGSAGRLKVEERYSTPRVIDLWRDLYNEVSR